jgi:hypothetical protein
LKAAASEFSVGETSKEEFKLKIDLLIGRVERIEINFIDTHIHTYQKIFNQLLFQRKHRAVEALKELKQTDRKQIFNARVRRILAAKLYFSSIYRTINSSMYGYLSKHGYKLKNNIQIFIEEGQDHE